MVSIGIIQNNTGAAHRLVALMETGGFYVIADDDARKHNLDAGETALFEFNPEDQFAYPLSYAKVEQAMKDYRTLNREFETEGRQKIKEELGA